MLHGKVPGDEAGGRGTETEEQQVSRHDGLGQGGQGRGPGDEERGRHEQQAPAEDALGGGQGLVAGLGDAPHDGGIDRPHDCRGKGEPAADEVGLGAAGEDRLAGSAADEHDAGHGQGEPESEGRRGGGARAPGEHDEGAEQGSRGRDGAHGGGAREGEGDVLEQEVAGHTRQARSGEQASVAAVGQGQTVGTQAAQGEKAQGEADDEKPQRREAGGDQHLGGDEGGAPHENGKQGEQMGFHRCVFCRLAMGLLFPVTAR